MKEVQSMRINAIFACSQSSYREPCGGYQYAYALHPPTSPGPPRPDVAIHKHAPCVPAPPQNRQETQECLSRYSGVLVLNL